MKKCPNCGAELADNAAFCTNCGAQFGQPVAYVNPFDHTGEFSFQDVSDNKMFALLPYLMGLVGVALALLANGRDSAFLRFHIRQAMKLIICDTLLTICCVVGIIPILGWLIAFAAGVCKLVLFVIKLITFFQICGGRSVEPAIVRSLGFLK